MAPSSYCIVCVNIRNDAKEMTREMRDFDGYEIKKAKQTPMYDSIQIHIVRTASAPHLIVDGINFSSESFETVNEIYGSSSADVQDLSSSIWSMFNFVVFDRNYRG